jgi:hypothetical protein
MPVALLSDSKTFICFLFCSSLLLKKNQVPSTAAMAHILRDRPTASPTVWPVCESAGAEEALLFEEAAVVEDDVLDDFEELDVEMRLAVVTFGANGTFSTPAPSSKPMNPPGMNSKLSLLQHEAPLSDGIWQQYVGLVPVLH